uniref:Reverse transcriptase domain-containing protein n=1 Tax=Glossina pallidipes TaxID=7398 RepID=A0A1B0AFP5_GLOPL
MQKRILHPNIAPTTFLPQSISEAELNDILKAMHTDTQGVDDIPLQALRRVPINSLQFIFNSMLLLEHTRAALKRGRTVLIPKNTLDEATKWRPLTISSVVIRAFHKILPRRPDQKTHILKNFLMPRIIACMQQPSITRKVLKEAD